MPIQTRSDCRVRNTGFQIYNLDGLPFTYHCAPFETGLKTITYIKCDFRGSSVFTQTDKNNITLHKTPFKNVCVIFRSVSTETVLRISKGKDEIKLSRRYFRNVSEGYVLIKSITDG